MPIDTGYQFMLDFIRHTFYPHFPKEIDAYEITNSYCFGDFDLSIDGKKICRNFAKTNSKWDCDYVIY